MTTVTLASPILTPLGGHTEKADDGARHRRYHKPSEWAADACADAERELTEWLAQSHAGGKRVACARAACAMDEFDDE